jgi:Zinc finger C-x8-C-x5-C-x3-H type (and similar)
VPCEFMKKGGCNKGAECTFSHDFVVQKLNVNSLSNDLLLSTN